MTIEEYRRTAENLAYLAACAVKEEAPDRKRAEQMDTARLLEVSKKHFLSCIAAIALEKAGIRDAAFTQEKGKAIRKAVTFDVARTELLKRLEEAGIWYLPLKGVILKEYYPEAGMRQMSDNDILYDADRGAELKQIMEELGYTFDHRSNSHEVYLKPPVLNFEMHTQLFGAIQNPVFSGYYEDVRSRLVKDRENRFGYHFGDEDFYIYICAHEYQHYSERGTGLRSLLDTWAFLRKEGARLDWDYIGGETKRLGIDVFERQNRSLSMHLFEGDILTAGDREMLDYILTSGAYGTVENSVANRVARFGGGRKGKLRYLLRRIFLPMDAVRFYYPLFAKVPVLLPFLPLWRLIRGLTVSRKKAREEFRSFRKMLNNS